MDIAALNVKIMFQKNETVVDSIGNHKAVWSDYFFLPCHSKRRRRRRGRCGRTDCGKCRHCLYRPFL